MTRFFLILFFCSQALAEMYSGQGGAFVGHIYAAYTDSLPADTVVLDVPKEDAPGLTASDSIRMEEMKAINPSFWDRINRENLCTGMKAPVQYRNGKLVEN